MTTTDSTIVQPQSTTGPRWLRRGILAASLVCLVAAVAGAARLGEGGGSPYTPSKGEWLCLTLNMDMVQKYSQEIPAEVNITYQYDPSKPDTINVMVVYNANVREGEVEAQARKAQDWAIQEAKKRGWDGWPKITAESQLVESRL